MVLNRTASVCVLVKWAGGGKGRMPDASECLLRWVAKPLKRLKTAMGSYWRKLAWI
jgi:hypothetical protein